MLDAVIAGLITGSAYAVLAVCVVLLYRLTGVVNLGLAAIGALGAYACYSVLGLGIPLGVAALMGVIVAGSFSAFCGWIMARWFGKPSETVRTAVSVVILILVLTLGFRLFGNSPRLMPSLFPAGSFEIMGVRVSLTTVIALGFMIAVSLGLTVILDRTRLGVRLQAMAEQPIALQLLGVNTRLLATGAWALTGVLATLAMLLVAPTRNPTFETMSFLIVPALIAALVGAFSRVWVAAVGGLAIGAIEGVGVRIEWLSGVRGAIPFAIVLIALIWLRRREVWDAPR